jgi:hypothetical protein
MARKQKSPVAPVVAEAPEAVVETPVVAAAPAAPAPVVVAGTEVTLTKSQVALTTAKHGGRVMPGQAGKHYTVGGKPYRVRTATNAAQWQAVLSAMQKGGGKATVEAMVAEGFPLTLAAPFVSYATNRGWLTEA